MRILLTLGIVLLFTAAPLSAPLSAQEDSADLDAIKTYLMENAEQLQTASTDLADAAQAYYDLAEAADFDYAALWESEPEAVSEAVLKAKEAWMTASPLYEQVEGVVAGVPVLSEYDVILDAGSSAEEDPESAVPFDLTLPDGRVLEQPGNLFGLLEATLWGTRPEFSSEVEADLDGNGEQDFGEVLPEANMLLSSAQTMKTYVDELIESAEVWQPNESDAFTALVVMVPTMSEYFGSWKESRFVAGEESSRTDFVVISRLADIGDILSGLQVVYDSVSPRIESADEALNTQIGDGLTNLQDYVGELYEQELDGKVFTAEEADFYGSEAQDRAMQITGQIAQAAALLEIELPEA